ncbi:MAG: DUF4391 domain-containing protein [Candidatus Eisenbacteria bacterium]|nr:DUF4391 domain-containing protein [Candidatus Eisenbacteria bacterium]
MNGDSLIAALDLPPASRVDQRIPKTLLVENGAPTSADRRQINEGIEELRWLYALKPTTVGVPEYRDVEREYLEIAVLRLTLRGRARAARLVELVHRAIPYPVLLLTEHEGQISLSAAHERWSQGEAGRTVLEDEVVAAEWDDGRDAGLWPAFRDALALGRQPRASLYALYQGWIDTLLALHAARVTGTFAVADNAEWAAVRRVALRECARLEGEIARLRASAAKEEQIARRVELNLELKRVEVAQAAARANL